METKRVNVGRSITGRARFVRLPVVVAVIAVPALAGCSSSSTMEYATDAYPSQSLVDLLTRPKESSPPAPRADSAPSAAAGVSAPLPAPATSPTREPAPIAATAVANPPPAAAPAEEADPVAAAYPSVSLIDLLSGARKPAP
jgi:hypothetical protein